MAHNITEIDKQQGLTQAWHGLTIIPENGILNRENIWLAQWDILPAPSEATLPDGRKVNTGFFNLTTTDIQTIQRAKEVNGEIVMENGKEVMEEILFTLGQPYNPGSYMPLSNSQFLDLVFNAIAGTDHKVTSAGSVCGREKIFLSVQLAGLEKFKAAGRDFEPYLNFGSGHGKTATLWINTSNIATCCANTFRMNYLHTIELAKEGDGEQISFMRKHTKGLQVKLPEIAKMIDQAIGVQAEFALEMNKLAEIPCNQNKAESIFAGFIAPPKTEKLSTRSANTVKRLVELFQDSKGGNDGDGMDDVFQSATDYYSHESSGGEDRYKQFVSSEFGAANNRKSEFFRMITDDEKREETANRGEAILIASKA